jgi:hypothetical protein
MRKISSLALVLMLSQMAAGGGVAYVAGASYFDPTTMGAPLTWAAGSINYYTDQGDLSVTLPGASADSFVATAFSVWTSIPTAAVSATQAGQLAEDVSGANVALIGGALTLPTDIQSNAVTTPVAIVYDNDGSVTDALLGSGAGASGFCASNAAFGGVDNFATDAHFAHALIILNGNCAATSAQLPDLQYHLVRVIGGVLGLDWSQANLNVITRAPAPTTEDYAGFPVMHEVDPPACVPVAKCYSDNGIVDPAQPKTDDQAALSRLYPVTAQNASGFPQKQISSESTARIRGSVSFTDANGGPGQAMQGVNVVARLIDPATGVPSGRFVASSISGFLFCGNAGNIVTGYTDSSGQNFDRFGSSDTALEGFFDLAGLPVPSGGSAQYQIMVEAADPLWSEHAGPYGPSSQVMPSGASPPMVVNVSVGGDVQQDIVMQGSAVATAQWYRPTSYASPAQLPLSGSWAGALNNYGVADFFQFAAKSNRTLSVTVNALDESGNPSISKVLPVIGMWGMANPGQSPAPAATPTALNTGFLGESRLDARILEGGAFRIGIADYRGDGRPDYRYNARVFYGDTVFPARASAGGGTPFTVQGLGLRSDAVVQVANFTTPVLASSATRLLVETPSVADGVYDVQLSDVNSGGNSLMSSVLTVGAGPNDKLKLIAGTNPATPVGAQAPLPFTVLVVADGNTPVAGASVEFSSSPNIAFSACSGGASCTLLTDQSGLASTWMTVLSANLMTLTAKLAPATYPNAKQVQTTLMGTESQLDLTLATPSVWVAQGAQVGLLLTARLLSNGNAVSGRTLNYRLVQGTDVLSASSAQTDSTGNAAANLQLSAASTGAQVSICVAPSNNPCQTFSAIIVPASSLQLQAVAGVLQVTAAGQNFQPVVVRVVDSATPAHLILGGGVFFQSLIGRTPQDQPIVWTGEAGISQTAMPVIIGKAQDTVQSDTNGLAGFPLSTGGISGDVAILGSASIGNASVQFAAQELGP